MHSRKGRAIKTERRRLFPAHVAKQTGSFTEAMRPLGPPPQFEGDDMRLRERAEEWLRDNNWDYQKYGDRRPDRSAYDGLMNYEISPILEEAFIAGFKACAEMASEIVQCTALARNMCGGPLKCAGCWEADEIRKLAEDGHGKEDLPNSKA